MAAVSQTMTTLTPPSSSHGWDIPMSERPLRDSKSHNDNYYSSSRPSQPAQYGTTAVFGANAGVDPVPRKYSNGESASDMKSRSTEPNSFQPHQHKDPRPRGVKENGSPADSPADLYEGGARNERAKGPPRKTAEEMYGGDSVYDDENSKWIHRDKLALIESAELQAAGIFLPKPRDRDRDSVRSKSQNRAKRDPGLDQGSEPPRAVSGPEQTSARSRKNSAATTGDPKTPDAASNPGWDLRLPEEIEEEGDGYWVSVSPVPIPNEQLERDKLLVRKRDSSPGEEDAITYPKTRARSGSTGNALAKTPTNGTLSQPAPQPSKPVSPKKGTPAAGARKPSGAKPNGAVGRPKTRGGPSKDSTSSGGGTRPSTRSGERELSIGSSKQMEGDPPWMVSAYRPDPRLPPDQQLLPTVAKRLQQEKWIREGKFGNVYDKEFRPLSDEGFPKRPDQDTAPEQDEEQNHDEKAEREDRDERDERDNLAGDWPLRAESKPARSSSYSTMPRISDKQTMSPLPSPRPPSQQHLPASVIRVQDPPRTRHKRRAAAAAAL
ncbi:hypothetical protein B0T16DRAFT_426648 [Cercophora newfieldiana]|uniref:Uncharacterized protein n=1 Tax=Cercophora newfieldiana TaxID=92897 RepID=A0AA39YHG3_9PEZI|nr:hypothetical protein B0T16DRAFT_426648 [Cercophora newfieldiana]